MKIRIAVEDGLSEIILRKLLSECGASYEIQFCYPQRKSGRPQELKSGWGYLYANRKAFLEVAPLVPHILLADLDNRPCCPQMIRDWFEEGLSNHNILFRIAEKEVEAWLLADFDGLMDYLQVHNARPPKSFSDIRHAKEAIVCYAGKSTNSEIKKAMLPIKRRLGAVGPGYNIFLSQFIRSVWDWKTAADNCDSLKRAIEAFRNFPSHVALNLKR